MPKARKRKVPLTRVETASSSSSTPHSSRTVIRRFHVLIKQRTQLQNATIRDAANAKALAYIDQQIADLGGLETYQRMSAIGQGNDRGGGSHKVLIDWLKEKRMSEGREGKLRLLEVGALKPDNYKSCLSWIDSTPMDLRSRHPDILEQDFLLMNESEHEAQWDIITLSLVINFVPDPRERGRMLHLAHAMLSTGGHLFLTLPLPCIVNSRYLTFEHFKALMSAVGFLELMVKWKEGGKMVYWLYQKQEKPSTILNPFKKKAIFRQGNRNNFSILL